jgi:hypothetical protein
MHPGDNTFITDITEPILRELDTISDVCED